jgi:hypothetical protein
MVSNEVNNQHSKNLHDYQMSVNAALSLSSDPLSDAADWSL